jgi:hypothetical protein
MENLNQLKARFGLAFKQFSTEYTELRRMRAAAPDGDASEWIHGVNAQRTRVWKVEHAYRSVRLEYVNRLLAEAPSTGRLPRTGA